MASLSHHEERQLQLRVALVALQLRVADDVAGFHVGVALDAVSCRSAVEEVVRLPVPVVGLRFLEFRVRKYRPIGFELRLCRNRRDVSWRQVTNRVLGEWRRSQRQRTFLSPRVPGSNLSVLNIFLEES